MEAPRGEMRARPASGMDRYGGTVYAMKCVRESLWEWLKCGESVRGREEYWELLMKYDELTLLEPVSRGREVFMKWLAQYE